MKTTTPRRVIGSRPENSGPARSLDRIIDPTERSAIPRNCSKHPGTRATWHCERCRLYSCDDCVRLFDNPETRAASCSCGARCVPYQLVSAQTKRGAESVDLRSAVVFPLQRAGGMVIAGGGLMIFVLGLISGLVPVIGPAVFAIMLYPMSLYLVLFAVEVCRRSATMPNHPVDWPEIVSPMSDVVVPLCRVACVTFFYLAASWFRGVEGWVGGVAWALTIVGAAMLPMAILSVTVRRGVLWGMPSEVIRGISRTSGDYVRLCLSLAAIFAVTWLLLPVAWSIPILDLALVTMLLTYTIAVGMRMLGLHYARCERELDWF